MNAAATFPKQVDAERLENVRAAYFAKARMNSARYDANTRSPSFSTCGQYSIPTLIVRANYARTDEGGRPEFETLIGCVLGTPHPR
jgi:hypothetical protein